MIIPEIELPIKIIIYDFSVIFFFFVNLVLFFNKLWGPG